MTSLPIVKRKVSVVVPTRDRPALLREALASIRALEGEDLTFEILIGDNGKDPGSRTAAEEFGAIHLPVVRNGAGAARNAGLEAATGDFIAFLDDDDVWTSTAVRGQIAVLDADRDLEACFAQTMSTDHELRPTSEAWPAESPGKGDDLVRTMLSGYYPQIGGTVVRMAVRKDVGLFDEALLGDQDWDWQLRIARRRKTGFSKTLCVMFRQRPPGSFDKLRLMRLGFTRRVFFRHAWPEWRVWKSPIRFVKAYTQTVGQYFEYFVDAAVTRARNGERGGTARAIMGAFRVFPARTMAHLILPRPLRRAAATMLWGKHRDHHLGAV
jgi:glycosyltransferase involved in cell wall biosynthesis